jgi:hypothetical protein
MNAVAGNMAWIVECLLVGLIVDVLLVLAFRKTQRA